MCSKKTKPLVWFSGAAGVANGHGSADSGFVVCCGDISGNPLIRPPEYALGPKEKWMETKLRGVRQF